MLRYIAQDRGQSFDYSYDKFGGVSKNINTHRSEHRTHSIEYKGAFSTSSVTPAPSLLHEVTDTNTTPVKINNSIGHHTLGEECKSVMSTHDVGSFRREPD